MRETFLVFGAPRIEEADIAEVVDSLRSGWLGTGPKVARFEDLFRRYTGAAHAVAVSSCTAALHLGLLAAGVGPGDEVITSAMTFVATANAIVHVGATPVLVDCDRRTGLIDPDRVEAAVTSRTRAVVPVHLHGRPCAMDAIMDIATRHRLTVLEDAAHATETRYRGRKVGTIGDMTAFSFYVTKTVTTGEGGMVTTASAALAETIKRHALHGLSHDAWRRHTDGHRHYTAEAAGFKYNMTDLQAALGLHQLARVARGLERRQDIWRRYDEAFAGLPVERPPAEETDTTHARHLYTLNIDPARAGLTRDAFVDRLHGLNVGTGVHFIGVHLQGYYARRFGYTPVDFPGATWISERTVSLPLSAGLTDEDVDDVIDAVTVAISR